MTIRLSAALAAVLAAAAAPAAMAANVGYYEMCTGAGTAAQAAAITAAGHTPVNVATPDAAGLAGLKALFVTNCNNGGFGGEYLANVAAINSAVFNGMTLIMHDRAVTGASGILPGGAGLSTVRDFADDRNIDLPAGSPIITGPGGTLTNTSLDNGGSSSHGYVARASLPAGGVVLAHQAAADRGVTVSYGHGAGRVVYSTIPLDHYLGNTSSQPAASLTSIYTPNVVAWATGPQFTSCAALGYSGTKLTLCRQICELKPSASTLAGYLTTWRYLYRSEPPCL